MVIDDVDAHLLHQPVEGQCGGALEEGVCGTFFPDPIDNVIASFVAGYHCTDGLHVVLQVGIDGYSDVTFFPDSVQTGHQGILMAYVSRQV